MTGETPFYVVCMDRDLGTRKKLDPRYSLRAYARHLRIDASALSRVLSRKQSLSNSIAISIVRTLGLIGDCRRLFLASVLEERKDRTALFFCQQTLDHGLMTDRVSLTFQEFERVADVEYLACLKAASLESCDGSFEEIAMLVGLTESRAREVIEVLFQLKLLRREDGKLIKFGPKPG